MTVEYTKRGIEAEARRVCIEAERIRRRDERRAEIAKFALLAFALVGGLALAMAFAATKRAERDAQAFYDHAHYELVAVTGGAR